MARSYVFLRVKAFVVLLLVASMLPSMASAQGVPDAQANRPQIIMDLKDPGRAMLPGGNESLEFVVTSHGGAG